MSSESSPIFEFVVVPRNSKLAKSSEVTFKALSNQETQSPRRLSRENPKNPIHVRESHLGVDPLQGNSRAQNRPACCSRSLSELRYSHDVKNAHRSNVSVWEGVILLLQFGAVSREDSAKTCCHCPAWFPPGVQSHRSGSSPFLPAPGWPLVY